MEKEQFSKKLGARIRALREKKDISLRDFEMYDESIDRHALSKIENGLTIPSVFTLYRISLVLQVPLPELVKDIDQE